MIIDPYQWHRLPIIAITEVASDTVAVKLGRPRDYRFKAGQYTVVRVTTSKGEQYIRQYSFSSAPSADKLELLIQHEPDGSVSSWFCVDARPDDIVELSQPFGSFVLEDTSRPILMIAGRVGIAPFLSMLRSEKPGSAKMLYSIRSSDQACFAEELETYDTSVIITSESSRIDSSLLRPHVENAPIVYLCGSKQFVDGITTMLHELGVVSSDIKRELFTLQ